MHDQRIAKLREILSKQKIEALLVSNFFNILYLTGFKTLTSNEREAFVLVAKNNIYLFTDSRYLDNNYQSTLNQNKFGSGQAINNLQLKLIEPNKGLVNHLQDIIRDEKIKALGFEAEDLRFYEYKKLQEAFKDITLYPTSKLVIKIREIKNEAEIKLIQKACEAGDQCLEEMVKIIKVGISEKEIAFKTEMWLKEKGYDLAFAPIVAIDANSAVAHYNTKDGEGVVKDGSVILIDFGVKYKDYLSDITRMVFLGKASDEIKKVYEILSNAQEKTIEKIADLESLKDVDDYCRKLITNYRLPNYPHSTGHGVGLEIHEYPKVSFNSPDRKLENQVFSIEPGIYFPGKWGMRVEDTVVIGKDLKAMVLTKFS